VTEPIPIVQVIVSTREGGGPQHVLTVAQGLRARGWRSIMVGPADGPLFARFGEAGLDAVALRTDRLQPLTLMRLVRLIRRTGARLVHSHGKGAGVHGRLAARLAGVPAVHTFHGIHYERYAPPTRAAEPRGLAARRSHDIVRRSWSDAADGEPSITMLQPISQERN